MAEIKKTATLNQFGLSNEELKNVQEILGQNVPFESIIVPENIPTTEGLAKSVVEKFKIESISEPKDLTEVAYKLIENKNIVSKDKSFESKVFEIKNSNKALAIATSMNAMFLNANAEIGAEIAVAEAYKKIVCTGAEPIALTCDIDLESKNETVLKAIAGIKKACLKLNISLTEQKSAKAQIPYGAIGMIGIIEDKTKRITTDFKQKGDMIFLIGESKEDISASEYLADFHGVKKSPTPFFNLDDEIKHIEILKELTSRGLVHSASVISKGGLFFSMLESVITQNFGFDITTDAEVRCDSYLFGESQERAIVTVASAFEEDFIDFMIANNYLFSTIGHVTKGEIRVDDESFGFIKEIKEIYEYILNK